MVPPSSGSGDAAPAGTLGDLLYAEPAPPELHETEWRALLAAASERDGGALLELYARSHRAVFTFLVRMACSAELAERVTAEAYADLVRAAPCWPSESPLVLSWLLEHARSLALARMREERTRVRARHGGGEGPFAFDMPDFGDILRLRSSEQRLVAAGSALGARQRRALEAVYFDGGSLREAARVLQREPREVGAELRGAMGALARALTGEDPTANPCPLAEATCAMAVGALEADELERQRAHVGGCRDCARETLTLGQVLDALVAWPTDVLRSGRALPSTVLGRVGASVPKGAFANRGPSWRTVAPQIACALLTVSTDMVGMFVRLEPGGVYPPHTHAGVEELYLLSGELWIDDRKVYPGGYSRAEPGSSDERVWSETGCTCVLITSANDALGGA